MWGRRAGAPAEAAELQPQLSLLAAALQHDASHLEISLGASWGGQREPQMRLKLCLVEAVVTSSRSKWSTRADSLFFCPATPAPSYKTLGHTHPGAPWAEG